MIERKRENLENLSFFRKTMFVGFKVLVLLLFFISANLSLQAKNIKVIVIDAGHGGEDPGAIGITGVKEKTINLMLALKLGVLIKAQYPDIKVIYTRKTDVFVKLVERANIANKNNADIFISIHCNSSANSAVHGTETFVMGMDKSEANLAIAQKENASILLEANVEENYNGFDPNSPVAYIIFSLYQNEYLTQSLKLASNIQSEFKNAIKRTDRGVKQAPLLVLWRTSMPSILIEAGFLSEKNEEAYLASEKGQTELTKAMFDGLSKLIKETNVQTEPTEPTEDSTVIEKTQETPSLVTYKVQIATLNTNIDVNKDRRFKVLKDVEVQQMSDNRYCYYSGKKSTYQEIYLYWELARQNGFLDAFVIALDQTGKRISITEARKREQCNN